jgi:hypothetical protein
MIGDGDCGEIDGIKIGRGGKPKYSEKNPVPAPLLSITKSHMTGPGWSRWEAKF